MSFWGLAGSVAFSGSQVISDTLVNNINNEYSITVLEIPSGTNDISLPVGRDNQLKFIYVKSANGIFRVTGNVQNDANLMFSNVGESALLLCNNEKWIPIEGSFPQLIPAFAQLSSNVNQIPVDTNETMVTFNIADGIENIENDNGTITILHSGLYHIILGGQMGKSSGGLARSLDMWIKRNDVDVPNTSVRNEITNIDSQVLILNVSMYLNSNDTIKVYMAVSDTNGDPGLYFNEPSVGPVIPSIIGTIFKIK